MTFPIPDSSQLPDHSDRQTDNVPHDREAWLHTLSTNLPGGFVCVVNRALRITLVGGEALDAAGFQPADIIGKTIDQSPYPERIADDEPLFQKALAGEPFAVHHISHGRKFLHSGTPLRDAHGQIDSVLLLTSDITKLEALDDALRTRESHFNIIFSSIDEGYCLAEMILDDDGQAVDYRFLETNALFEAMTGLHDAVGRTAYELVPNLEPHWVETYAQVALGGETMRFENGSQAMGRWFDVFATPVKPRGRFALVFKDVTERKRIEEERAALLEREQTARLEAERATELQRRFLGMVSHELRTPLSSIKGFSSTLLSPDVAFSADEQREFLRVIDTEADKLTELIDQLLNVVRLQAGTLGVTPVPTEVSTILQQAMPQLRSLAAHHRLRLDVAPAFPTVLADTRRVAQVLVNLVDNAAKFSAAQTTITVSVKPDDDHVRFAVSDEGDGIPLSERDSVFEAFHQIHSTRGRQRGTGLGLAICKGLVEAQGGTIWVEGQTEPGSTIVFTLPVATPDSA